MAWLTIIMMILSFFLAKKNGASNGKAALIAGASGLATWAVADPANENSVWGEEVGKALPFLKTNGVAEAAAAGDVTKASGGWSSLNNGVNAVADVAKTWGPAGVVGATVGVKSSSAISDWISANSKWLLPVGAGLAALFILGR